MTRAPSRTCWLPFAECITRLQMTASQSISRLRESANGISELSQNLGLTRTPEEVSLMLQQALQLVPRYYPLLLCAVRTGIRQGEFIALQSQDLNFGSRLIHVRRTLSRNKLKLPKSGKTRMVDMSKQLTSVLRELK